MADIALYNPKGLLIALGPYVVPLRIGVYLMNSPGSKLLKTMVKLRGSSQLLNPWNPDSIVVGIDVFGKGMSCPGGTLEPKEKLLDAGMGEYQEECGSHCNPYLISEKSVNFLSTDFKEKGQEHLDDLTVDPDEIVIGQDYKLRTYVRTACNEEPEQQPPEEGNLYPELIDPHFEPITMLWNQEHRIIRKSTAYAIGQAAKQRMLFTHSNAVKNLDYNQIANDWEKRRIHPDIIAFFCGEEQDYSSSSDRVFDGLMKNLDYSAKGLKHLLQHRLPIHESVRKHLVAHK